MFTSKFGLFTLAVTSPDAGFWHRRLELFEHLEPQEWGSGNQAGHSIDEFLNKIAGELTQAEDVWIDSDGGLESWSNTAEAIRGIFGETWAGMSLAIRSSGVPGSPKPRKGSELLFAAEIPVCERARHARLRRGSGTWWSDMLKCASSDLDRTWWVGLFILWASPNHFSDLASSVNAIVDDLSVEQYEALDYTIRRTRSACKLRADRQRLDVVDLREFSARSAKLLISAFGAPIQFFIISRTQRRTEPLKAHVERDARIAKLADLPSWKQHQKALSWAKEVKILMQDQINPTREILGHLSGVRFSVNSANDVLIHADSFPLDIVSRAIAFSQRKYRTSAISDVVAKEGWEFVGS